MAASWVEGRGRSAEAIGDPPSPLPTPPRDPCSTVPLRRRTRCDFRGHWDHVPSPGLLQSLPLNGLFSSIFSGTAWLLHSLALPPPAGHPAHPTAEVNLLGQATSCLRFCQTSSTGGRNLPLGPAGSQLQALPMQENKPGLQDGDRRAQHAPLLDPA